MRGLKSIGKCIILSALIIAQLGAAQATQLTQSVVTEKDKAQLLKGLIASVRDLYVLPDASEAIVGAIRASQIHGNYRSISNGDELARKISEDLQHASGDKHFRVAYFADGVPASRLNPPSEADIQAQHDFFASINFGFVRSEWLEGNVGYVEIRGLPAVSMLAETAEAAMSFVAHTDALIVDLRRNSGGEPNSTGYVLSYLFDAPTHLDDLKTRFGENKYEVWTQAQVPGLRFGERKPVYVLTSHDTFSGGEAFAYDVQAFKRGRIVGEATGGGAHAGKIVALSEHFIVNVPYVRAVNLATLSNWNGTGVLPDVPTPAKEALDVAYRLALEALLESTSDIRRRDRLKTLLDERKTMSK